MIIFIHVMIALASVAHTTYLFILPTDTKFKLSYLLIGATLTSGAYLVWSTHSNMLKSCMTGLIYISIVVFGLAMAKRKLSRQENTID